MRKYKEFDRCWQGAVAGAEKFGFRLEEFRIGKELGVGRLQQVLQARGIQGILLPPEGPAKVDWTGFDWNHFSTVRLGRTDDTPEFHFVTSAQLYNATKALSEMRARGYRRIGFVGRLHRSRVFGAGFLWSQAEWPKQERVEPFYWREGESRRLEKPFATWIRKEKPDAILAETAEVPKVLHRLGYRVPKDIGLAGTTILDTDIDAGIHQNPEEIGRVAALALISMVHDNERGIPEVRREILVQGKWVDGSSLPQRTP